MWHNRFPLCGMSSWVHYIMNTLRLKHHLSTSMLGRQSDAVSLSNRRHKVSQRKKNTVTRSKKSLWLRLFTFAAANQYDKGHRGFVFSCSCGLKAQLFSGSGNARVQKSKKQNIFFGEKIDAKQSIFMTKKKNLRMQKKDCWRGNGAKLVLERGDKVTSDE